MATTSDPERERIKVHETTSAIGARSVQAYKAFCACGWEAYRPFATLDEAMAAAEAHRDAYRMCGV